MTRCNSRRIFAVMSKIRDVANDTRPTLRLHRSSSAFVAGVPGENLKEFLDSTAGDRSAGLPSRDRRAVDAESLGKPGLAVAETTAKRDDL